MDPRDTATPARPTMPADERTTGSTTDTTPQSTTAAAQPNPPPHRTAGTSTTPTTRTQSKTHPLRDPRLYLAAYAALLAAIAFWPIPVDSGAGPLIRAITRLFPLLTYDRIEFLANIALFVPLGLLLTLIITRQRWLVLPIAILATVTIECVQAIALAQRTPSLLDIVANTAGACLGMLLAVLIESLRRSRPAPPVG